MNFSPLTSALGEGRLLQALRSRWIGMLWLFGAAWVALLLWQLLVGWPLLLTMPVTISPKDVGLSVMEGKIRSSAALPEWNSPWGEVSANGRALPVYRSRKSLQSATGEGCLVKESGVLLKLADPSEARSPNFRCVARVSWSLSWAATAAWLVGFAAVTAVLAWLRHPWLLRFWRSAAALPWPQLAFGTVLLIAVLLRFGGFAFPSWHRDSDEFLHPAADLAAGRSMSVTDRPLGYALVVGLALRCWEDLRAILLLHQLSSLLFAVVLAVVLWLSAVRLFPAGGWRALALVSAILATACWGWHERILQREWHLIPEAMAPLYMAGQVLLLWRLCTRPFSMRRALAEFALFCVLGWAIYFTKPNWGLAVGIMPLAWMAYLWSREERRASFWKGACAGAAAFLVISCGALACQLITPANTEASLEIRYRVLVCWHLPMVQHEISRRLAAQPPDPERALLEELVPVLETELALAAKEGAGVYASLGYDADRLYYRGYQRARRYWALPRHERIAFTRRLFLGALRQEPLEFARYVLGQTRLFFLTPYGSAGIYLPQYLRLVELGEGFVERPDPYFSPQLLERYRTTLAEARSTLEQPWPSAPRMALSLRTAPLPAALNAAFVWCTLLPMGILALVGLVPAWRRKVDWRLLLPVLCLAAWAFLSALASAFSSSLAQALEIQRYIDLFMPVSLLAQFLWPWLGVAVWLQLRGAMASESPDGDL